MAAWHNAVRAIIATPARSLAGLAVKARLLRRELDEGDSVHGLALADSLLADLDRLVDRG